ncbi:hypothetical protein [Desulfoluna butyratoxydans]|uniref:hypothetical protein n=1 Tax=Desulfoluna butyratoxydans TaxID=231438 RepID=UPI0015D2A138|nr:hypothetical protein [Desulfoluna butyratoxydans]
MLIIGGTGTWVKMMSTPFDTLLFTDVTIVLGIFDAWLLTKGLPGERTALFAKAVANARP